MTTEAWSLLMAAKGGGQDQVDEGWVFLVLGVVALLALSAILSGSKSNSSTTRSGVRWELERVRGPHSEDAWYALKNAGGVSATRVEIEVNHPPKLLLMPPEPVDLEPGETIELRIRTTSEAPSPKRLKVNCAQRARAEISIPVK